VPVFVLMQLVGGAIALGLVRVLYPDAVSRASLAEGATTS